MIARLPIFAAVVAPAFSWDFGGPLARVPMHPAWTILISCGIVGLALIAWSYFTTWVTLTPGKKTVLIAIRAALWISILLVLAGPTKVQKTFSQKQNRPSALLVDRSGSMVTADHRGRRRVDDALRRWFALAPAGPAPRAFAFSNRLVELKQPDDEPAGLSADETRLFASLDELLHEAPAEGWGSIITLTDGLDTAVGDVAAASRKTIRAAQSAGTPLYFILGTNLDARENPFVACRDLTLPDEVPPHSTFTITLVADSYQAAAQTLPTRVRIADQWQPAAPLFVGAGRHVALWQQTVSAEQPGPLPIEIEIGTGPDRLRLQTSVAVTDPTRITRVLYYEGALDWSRKFLANLLRRDAAFEMSSIIHVEPTGAQALQRGHAALRTLPSSSEGFQDIDLLIVANASAQQIDPDQQKAMADWVGTGGTLLFLAPDDRAASGFAGTELEKLLPVTFPSEKGIVQEAAEVKAFRREMGFLGHSNSSAETNFAAYAMKANALPDLIPFSWESPAKEIFSTDGNMPEPLFAGYAKVVHEKPGARVYARHPTDLSANGQDRAILLAMQSYGRGQVAVLTCDVLWRWKLQEPSDHREVEMFWQQLFAWLGRQHQREQALHFDDAPLVTELGKTVNLRLKGEHLNGLETIASAADQMPVHLKRSHEELTGVTFQWTPSQPGFWAVEATNELMEKTTHWITVQKPVVQAKGEYSGLPPDEAVVQELAGETGGAILNETAPASWMTGQAVKPALLSEHHFPLWNRKIFLTIFLGLYVLEWLLRRKFKLL